MFQVNRRVLLRGLSLALVGGVVGTDCRGQTATSAAGNEQSGLGLVQYCVRIRREHLLGGDAQHDLFAPHNFLEHCRQVGAGGVQCSMGRMAGEDCERLRAMAETSGMFIEAIIRLPSADDDVPRFQAEMETAQRVGALAVRTTIISGRRYEVFDQLEDYRRQAALGRAMLLRAAPIAERLRLPIAVENHKDQRNHERLELLEEISSEFVGVCLDTGNSLALLEDPLQTIRDFAPWAHSVHLKDQSLRAYQDGFLLGDVPLGQGSLDLPAMVETIREVKPNVRFSLELITRDELQVPCLNEKYWATFPALPARELAAMLRYVRAHPRPGQRVSQLDAAEQLVLEDRNVRQSLDYARDVLKI